MSQLVFSIDQNPREVALQPVRNGLASENKSKQAKSESLLPSSQSFMWAATRRCGPDLRVGLPTSSDAIKKNPSQISPATWALVNSKYSQVGKQGEVSTTSLLISMMFFLFLCFLLICTNIYINGIQFAVLIYAYRMC